MFANNYHTNKGYEFFLLMHHKISPPVYNKWWLKMSTYSDSEKESITFCYDMLSKVSRSFSHVIRIVPNALSLELLVFYLRCRALDTVEDDPNAFDGDIKSKKKYLKKFYTHYNSLKNVGEEKYRPLLENYHKIGIVHNLLERKSQEIVDEAVKDMGRGMSQYLHYRIENMEQYNEYCYYVAGLVARGFNKLFIIHKFVDPDFLQKVTDPSIVCATHDRGGLEMSAALLLQKTNITRDYKEDIEEGIQWYPQDIWKKYKTSFHEFDGDIPSRNCVNELVTDALECVQDTLHYHTYIRHPDVFKFCAIPQVMAIATLNDLYDNPKVFETTIKIEKGLTLNIMHHSNNMNDMYYWFKKFVLKIKGKIREDDPNSIKTHRICDNILSIINKEYHPSFLTKKEKFIIIILISILYLYYK